VIILLTIWVLYALGMIQNIPNSLNNLFDKIHNSISNLRS
jgi:hypothetical protein